MFFKGGVRSHGLLPYFYSQQSIHTTHSSETRRVSAIHTAPSHPILMELYRSVTVIVALVRETI